MTPPAGAGARTATASPRAGAQVGGPVRRPVGPRRVSGPAGPARPAERVDRPTVTRPQAPFTQHVARVVDHSLLDRLIRGRAWIGLIAFALIGIVTMQVTLLRLNAGIGRSIARVTALQRESSLLAAQVAGLSSAARVQAEATQLGMVYAPPDDVRYLHASPGDASRAAASFVAPAAGLTASTALTATTGTTASTSTSATGSTASAPTPSAPTPSAPTSTATSTGSTGSGASSSPASTTAIAPTGP